MKRALLAGIVAGLLAVPTAAGAQEIPGPPEVGLEVSRAAFSPNGDGRVDRTVVLVTLSADLQLTLRVLGPGGEVARLLLDGVRAGPGEIQVPWAGDGERGDILADGGYVVDAQATDALGAVATAEAMVAIDTRAPEVGRPSVEPDPYLGRGPVRFSFRATDRDRRLVLTATALVDDATGRLVVLPRTEVQAGRTELRWDGLDDRGRAPIPGLRTVAVRVRDDAGNVGSSPARAFRDHRPSATHVIRRIDGAGGRVALTFDDCYDAGAWERILDVLDDRHATASFFCLGPYVRANPRLARRTADEGHAVGAHGWDHAGVRSLSGSELRGRVRREASAWWRVAKVTPVPLYRPVGGDYDAEALHAVGEEGFATVVLWDVDPWDWSRPGATAISARVLGHVRSGSIVVLHAIDQTAAALPAILSGLRNRGLEPVGLTELVHAGT